MVVAGGKPRHRLVLHDATHAPCVWNHPKCEWNHPEASRGSIVQVWLLRLHPCILKARQHTENRTRSYRVGRKGTSGISNQGHQVTCIQRQAAVPQRAVAGYCYPQDINKHLEKGCNCAQSSIAAPVAYLGNIRAGWPLGHVTAVHQNNKQVLLQAWVVGESTECGVSSASIPPEFLLVLAA